MYIILVPLLGIFMKKRAGLRVWISVAMAVAGLYLLCMTESFSISRGDAYVMVCALIFCLSYSGDRSFFPPGPTG